MHPLICRYEQCILSCEGIDYKSIKLPLLALPFVLFCSCCGYVSLFFHLGIVGGSSMGGICHSYRVYKTCIRGEFQGIFKPFFFFRCSSSSLSSGPFWLRLRQLRCPSARLLTRAPETRAVEIWFALLSDCAERFGYVAHPDENSTLMLYAGGLRQPNDIHLFPCILRRKVCCSIQKPCLS
jgi:hypothetical protein